MEPQDYLRSLRERHRAQAGTGGDKPSVGDVVIIKSEDEPREVASGHRREFNRGK